MYLMVLMSAGMEGRGERGEHRPLRVVSMTDSNKTLLNFLYGRKPRRDDALVEGLL